MDTALFIAPKTDRTSLLTAEDRGGVRVEPDQRSARMIVADGAGTAHRSGLLAELMVESFIGNAGQEPPIAPLDNASYQRWLDEVSMQWRRLAEEETGSQWYEQQNLERGSAAAFAAAVVKARSCWCVAVGDCCLFHIRPGPPPTCVASFPIRTWAAFNSTPALLRTDVRLPIIWPQWTRLQVNPGDTLLGSSDGISEWILAAAVQNPEVWQVLIEMGAADFVTLVNKERELGTMVDDDAIVVRLTFGSDR